MRLTRSSVLALAIVAIGTLVPSTGQAAFGLPTDPAELVPRWSAFVPAGDDVINTETAYPSVMAVSPDGARTYVAGRSGTVAYDAASGTQLWSISPLSSGLAVSPGLAVSSDGARVYVSRRTFEGSYDIFTTTAHDALTGAQLWVTRYESPEPCGCYKYRTNQFLAVSPDGTRVYVTGRSSTRNATVAYDATDGGQLWATRSTAGGFANGLAVSPDGTRVYLSGEKTLALDAVAGSQLWSAGGAGFRGGLAMSPKGESVYVVGFDDDGVITSSYATADGSLRWLVRHAMYVYGNNEAAIAVSPDDRQVYVTWRDGFGAGGFPAGGGSSATLAYNSVDGSLGWLARFPRDYYYFDLGTIPLASPNVSVSPDGSRVYVTGSGYNSARIYCILGHVCLPLSAFVSKTYSIILVYDARQGTEMSVTSFEAAVSDVALSPDGSRLFATGSIQEYGDASSYVIEHVETGYRFYGYATVAYCTAPAVEVVDYLLALEAPPARCLVGAPIDP